MALTIGLWAQTPSSAATAEGGRWLIEYHREWIPHLGISFFFAMDDFDAADVSSVLNFTLVDRLLRFRLVASFSTRNGSDIPTT